MIGRKSPVKTPYVYLEEEENWKAIFFSFTWRKSRLTVKGSVLLFSSSSQITASSSAPSTTVLRFGFEQSSWISSGLFRGMPVSLRYIPMEVPDCQPAPVSTCHNNAM